MKLQTQIPLKKETKNLINYDSNIFLLGSCFSENIGNKLSHFKFQSIQNPFGILFHPKAIETLITNAVNQKVYSSEDVFLQNEVWHSFDVHSSLSSENDKSLLKKINSAISVTNKKLKEASHIIITLGTSWVYRFIETDTIVANCHKIPQKKFLKELLTVDEITKSLSTILVLLKSINKNIHITFTVSPIRHLKDGFVENTQSKSNLISAIHTILVDTNVSYFPSYEIMMDELRDYRFYAEDMIHPNKTAINYIWEKFVDTRFSEESLPTMKEIEAIQKGILHRPFHEKSEQHQHFLEKIVKRKNKIKSQFPFIKF
ncbi:GSCFA domain-containing protein [Polaribacter sp.]|uniref:GSCFA domain-containing protein n=1 Tax=Polaribacter sp. TaxID=1920175 RepID=UPI0026162572|nr:GSCFA domain-containing protein [Polaribacter sp.]MBT3741275.1 GSCFA domain-containing protein [Polaribacter sp.]MBT4412770.1 GSCFA domain-containing protein [Polaribacter sp.]MDG1403643.1 GSCFA domain-containing protein [Polaribacter sp.]MDG2437298.1 GSCFA domain-containing protein [Polaribacter sp.]